MNTRCSQQRTTRLNRHRFFFKKKDSGCSLILPTVYSRFSNVKKASVEIRRTMAAFVRFVRRVSKKRGETQSVESSTKPATGDPKYAELHDSSALAAIDASRSNSPNAATSSSRNDINSAGSTQSTSMEQAEYVARELSRVRSEPTATEHGAGATSPMIMFPSARVDDCVSSTDNTSTSISARGELETSHRSFGSAISDGSVIGGPGRRFSWSDLRAHGYKLGNSPDQPRSGRYPQNTMRPTPDIV